MKNYNGYRGNGGRSGGYRNNRNRSNWSPVGCGRVVNIELDQRLLNSLREFCEEDGVGCVFQMIRNILYKYVTERKGEGSDKIEAEVNVADEEKENCAVTFVEGDDDAVGGDGK